MTIKEIMAKVLKGETLTDAEKQFVEAYDPEKALNDAAAAARRKAEADKTELQKQLDALKSEKDAAALAAEEAKKNGMTEAQKLAAQIEALNKSVAEISKAKAESDKQAATMARRQAINHIRETNRIRFIDGVDRKLVDGAFEAAFEGLDTLNDEAAVKSRLSAFTTANKALIADESGHGAGLPPGTAPATARAKEIADMTDAQRAQDLQKKGLV
jgi:hypothetical protein